MKRLPVLILLPIFSVCPAHAHGRNNADPLPAWQIAAGASMAFEVASVREDKSPFKPPSFPLSADDSFRDPNGRFHADFALPTYIQFAYKINLTSAESSAVLEKLPPWVRSDRFAVDAVAPLHATKDQYRLMMQQLLADRFHLKLHFERKETPVLAMVLVKPGHPGPRLISHALGQPCDEKPRPETYPEACYTFSARPEDSGLALFAARATSMELIAAFIGNVGGGPAGEIDRHVVDQTGLSGLWDYTLEIAPPWDPTPQAPAVPGATVLEGLRDQLGIKLKPARALVALPVIDSLQRPGDN